MTDTQPKKRSQTRSRLTLLLIVALFVAPLLAAIWLYQRVQDEGVWDTVNHGRLIRPAQPLEGVELSDIDGDPVTGEDLRERWTLLFIPGSPCEAACRKNIYHMRQVWASLGREAPRVQRWLLVDSPDRHAALAGFLEDYPRMAVVVDRQRRLIGPLKGAIELDEPAIYLVDPLGNLMMAFPQSLDPRDMLKDLKKLLKVSRIG
jgi:cytochrome oxidase Cu insertion factor (SCO1/SenC/PrrC family)